MATPPRRRIELMSRVVPLVLGLLLAMLPILAPAHAEPVAAATSTTSAPINCSLPDDGSMGRIPFETFRRPIGTLNVAMIFVDFPDAPATGAAETILEDVFSPGAETWLSQSSYGKLALSITPLRHWLRMPEPVTAYKTEHGALVGEVAKRFIGEAIALADPEVDFSQTQILEIVVNPEATAYTRSNERIYDPKDGVVADGRVIRSVVTFGSTVYERGYRVLDHETSHAFGLHDYYSASGALDRYTGAWSLMADSVAGGDHFAWDKWRMGWLTDTQIRCVNAASRADYTLSPLETVGGTKAVILRTGVRSAVVAEFRTRQGLDSGICSTGVLIYKVNSAVEGGLGLLRVSDARPGTQRGSATCSRELADAAYKTGGLWTDSTSGLAITVTAVGSTSAHIRVTRSRTYRPPARFTRTFTTSVVPNPTGTTTLTAVLGGPGAPGVCGAFRSVSLQERKFSEWWTIRTAYTNSLATWKYTWTPALDAIYRLMAPEFATPDADCLPVTTDQLKFGG